MRYTPKDPGARRPPPARLGYVQPDGLVVPPGVGDAQAIIDRAQLGRPTAPFR